MSEVAQVLTDYEIRDFNEADVAEALRVTFGDQPRAAAAPLSSAAVDYLSDHGGEDAKKVLDEWDPAAEDLARQRVSVTGLANLVRSTLTPGEVAEHVGKDPSRVRHWINATPPQLFTLRVGARRRVPAWQIADSNLLPHLSEVIAAIPEDVHPLDVATVMTSAQEELAGRTPVDHLTGGGSPAPVVELLESLDR